jgi:hypothetical protein
MNDMERFAAKGEAFENQQKTAEEIRTLRIAALNLGRRLESLGKTLQTQPESVVFDGRSFDGCVNALFSILPTDLDAERLKSLTDTLRAELSNQEIANAVLGA